MFSMEQVASPANILNLNQPTTGGGVGRGNARVKETHPDSHHGGCESVKRGHGVTANPSDNNRGRLSLPNHANKSDL